MIRSINQVALYCSVLLLSNLIHSVVGNCSSDQYDDGSGCQSLSTCDASNNKYVSQEGNYSYGVANIGYTSGFTSAYYVALTTDGSEKLLWGSKTTADPNTVNLKKAIAVSALPAQGEVFLKQDGTISGTADNADSLYPIGDNAPAGFGLDGGIEIIEKVQKNNGIGIIFFNSQSGFYCDVGVSQLAKCSNNRRTNVVKYAAIQNYGVCILKTDNAVECKGYIAGHPISPLDVEDVKDLESIQDSFAAVKTDGSVVAWSRYGLSTISSGADKIFSTKYAFAVINTDKSVHAWGDSSNGGDASGVTLTDVQTIFSTDRAFAALTTDKSVVVWGNTGYGGDASGVTLTNVETIVSTDGAFAALKSDGSVEVWGGADYGGDKGGLDLTNVVTIVSTERSFAALKTDGSVLSWGKVDSNTDIITPDNGSGSYTSDRTCADCASGTHTTNDNENSCTQNQCSCSGGTAEIAGGVILPKNDPRDARMCFNSINNVQVVNDENAVANCQTQCHNNAECSGVSLGPFKDDPEPMLTCRLCASSNPEIVVEPEFDYYPKTVGCPVNGEERCTECESTRKLTDNACECDTTRHFVADNAGGCECASNYALSNGVCEIVCDTSLNHTLDGTTCTCATGYVSNEQGGCRPNQCTCTGGVAATGAACIIDGQEQCASCSSGYQFDECDLCDRCELKPVCKDTDASNYNEYNLLDDVFSAAPIDNSVCTYNLGGVFIGTDIDLDDANDKPSMVVGLGEANPKSYRKKHTRTIFQKKAPGQGRKFKMAVNKMLMDGFKRQYAPTKEVMIIEPQQVVGGDLTSILPETISGPLSDEAVYAPLLELEAVKLNLEDKGFIVTLYQTTASTLQATVGSGDPVDIVEGGTYYTDGLIISQGSGIVEDDVECSKPANTDGYVNLPDTIYNGTIADYTSEACAAGYGGTAVLDGCTQDSQTYTLSGCSPCGDDQYSLNSQCEDDTHQGSCAAGNGFNNNGPTEDSTCTDCSLTNQWSDGTTECKDYTPGKDLECVAAFTTFIDGENKADHSCNTDNCGVQGFGPGSTASQGSPTCDSCIAGHGGDGTGTKCEICPVEEYNTGTTVITLTCVNKACARGYGVINTGSTAASGDGSCELCPAGEYSDSDTTGVCHTIPAGHGCTGFEDVTNYQGCTAIRVCTNGEFPNNYECTPDTNNCNPGEEFSAGGVNTADDGTCTPCEGNEYSISGGASCQDDTVHEITDCTTKNHEFIIGTNPAANDGECKECADDAYSTGGPLCVKTQCVCEHGHPKKGEHCKTNTEGCESCNDSSFENENGVCKCPSGTHLTGGTCETNVYNPIVEPQDPGQLVDGDWSATCADNEYLGVTEDNGVECQACNSETFKNAYASDNRASATAETNANLKHYKCCSYPSQVICTKMLSEYRSKCVTGDTC